MRTLLAWLGFFVCLLVATGSALAQVRAGQTLADSTEQDSAAHFDVMFLAEPGDTIVFTSPQDSAAFAERDTIRAITERDVFDTLHFRSYVPATPYELIEDRLSCIQADMPLTFNKTVNSFINFFTVRKRNYTQTMLERMDYYFPIFEEALRRYQLPDELKYLAIVESGLNTRAYSRSGAVGLWQFMGPTGRDLKLQQDKYIDERMDPHKATEAACRYLRFLYNQFSDWELALAAYNCGPGAIRRTLARTGGRTFWQIYNALPQETRSYVPQFTAVVYSINYAKEHNLYPDADSMLRRPVTDTIVVDKQVNLTALAHHLQLDAAELAFLNPQLRKPVSPEIFPYTLNLPVDAATRFRQERACWMDSCLGQPLPEPPPRASRRKPAPTEVAAEGTGTRNVTVKKRHTVRRGETLFAIADRYNTTIAALRKTNHLRSGKVRPGQHLTVLVTKAVKTKAGADSTLARKTFTHADSLIGPVLPKPSKDSLALLAKAEKKGKKGRSKKNKPDAVLAKADTAPKAQDTLALASAKPLSKPTAKPTPAEAKATKPAPKETAKPAAQQLDKKVKAAEAPKPQPEPVITGTRIHEVQPGDTLWGLSQRYGMPVAKLMELNGLKDKNLKLGQKLIVG